MKKYFEMLRVKHYIKNILIFVPLFFSLTLFSPNMLIKGIVAFIQFCMLSSCVYIINDMKDIKKDRAHPTKCHRPLAAGTISLNQAKIMTAILMITIIVIQVLGEKNNYKSWLVLFGYFFINILYSVYGLKNKALVDVYILSIGFVLRIMFGSSCTGIEISSWLYLVVFFGALFMGFGKRRNELIRCGDSTRAVLSSYNADFLGKCLYSSMTLSIIFYSFWCLEKDTVFGNKVYLFSVPLFAFILLRYALDIEMDEDGDPTNVILSDILLIVLVIVLAVFLGIIMYLE